MIKKSKVIVLFSGGLDSILALKLMQKQNLKVTALFFKLPFIKNIGKDIKNFCKENKVDLKIFDCTKGKLLKEYLEIIRNPKYGVGVGLNPCIDCRIFILKKTKEFADKKEIELICTGDVLGERPMSQMKKSLEIIENDSNLKKRIFRPLSAKLLEETDYEKKGFINKENFYDFQGRRRENQIKLAKKFKIKNYPNPSGGCLLCEKELKKRFIFLLKRVLNKDNIKLIGVGRHFFINNCWVILGRNKIENRIIESTKGTKIVPSYPAPSVIVFNKLNKETKLKINDLIKAYSKKGSLEERKEFEKYKL